MKKFWTFYDLAISLRRHDGSTNFFRPLMRFTHWFEESTSSMWTSCGRIFTACIPRVNACGRWSLLLARVPFWAINFFNNLFQMYAYECIFFFFLELYFPWIIWFMSVLNASLFFLNVLVTLLFRQVGLIYFNLLHCVCQLFQQILHNRLVNITHYKKHNEKFNMKIYLFIKQIG